MNIIKTVIKYYNKVPLKILNIFAPLYHLLPDKVKYTQVYCNELEQIKKTMEIDEKSIALKENELLKKLINYSYNHVPYYKELFDSNGIEPNEITDIHSLQKIPFLTKELLIKNREKLISDEYTIDDLVYITTSGSTGTPTGFYVQKDSHLRDLAYVSAMFSKLGYGISSSRLILRGKKFISLEKGKMWQWDAFKKELSINIFDMSDENMEMYCQAIERYKPNFAYGYISAMYSLCKYIARRKGGLNHSFRAFIGISEMILDEQKEFVEKVINAPVKTFYGMSERVVIALEEQQLYKIMPMYGIAELVDNEGCIIAEPNKTGEIVGTSLLNYGMPLIRYKMGDLSSWSNKDSVYGMGDKGRVLNKIQGRNKKDVLINSDNQIISLASMEVHSEIYNYMERYQFVQSEVGKAIILVVLQPKYKQDINILVKIKDVFTERTQGKVLFEVKEVEKIASKKNGKLSIIIQNLNIDDFE